MSVELYNFRKPGRLDSDVKQQLADWLRAGCELAPTKWAKHFALPMKMEFRGHETARPVDSLASLPEAAIGFRLTVNPGSMNTLVVLPRPLALALVGYALGERDNALPPDAELTAVEESLCEYVVQNLLMVGLQETWPSLESLEVKFGQRELSPRWTRMFPPYADLVTCTFALNGPFGEQDWHWIVPQKELLEQLGHIGEGPSALQEKETRPRLESIVQELPVEISVALGTVQLPIAQLALLAPGDVIILSQRVSEPLHAQVADKQKFRVWPGRIGLRQAVQIQSLCES
jgi:flagellar motor switch protein FliM